MSDIRRQMAGWTGWLALLRSGFSRQDVKQVLMRNPVEAFAVRVRRGRSWKFN